MLNQDIYVKDPVTTRLLNNGVAKVADAFSAEERRTLRYELETFVCEGEYQRGLERILQSFTANLNASEQPAVWVSGFFGSGKSHLVKMLRALWVDYVFPEDRATARGLVDLPESITDLLRELSIAGRRQGGLHAASGTLGAGVQGHVRPALLSIVFRSAGLPEAYPQARFVMWLRREGMLDQVRDTVEQAGRDWQQELSNMYVSRHLPDALIQADRGLGDTATVVRDYLREQFPNQQDVSKQEMVAAVREALSQEGHFPLTLIVLDEVQQYIGGDQDRTYQIQETAETCSEDFGTSLMFIGTGQTALAGTPSMQRLMARFAIPIQLSDTDVDAVVRKNILAKKPEARSRVQEVATEHIGEVSRHLQGTEIGHRPEDVETLVADYPLLPVRRRFWERCLRSLDPTGTQSQLRSQLSIVLEACRQTAERELGCVVAGDFVFDELAANLLQTGILSREIYERIMELKGGGEAGQLQARLCALIFLIGKLPREAGADLGLRVTESALADLLVEDLRQGSGPLRQRLPSLLESLVEAGLLMRIDEEYRLQTREGSDWNDEFRTQLAKLQSTPQLIENERLERFRQEVRSRLGEVRILQGQCKEPRKPEIHFGAEPPAQAEAGLFVWVRDGWDVSENTVLTDARAAGNESPMLFVFIPRNHAAELRAALADSYAAQVTLDVRGVPSTAEGTDARNAMLTRQSSAEKRSREALDDIFSEALVYQGGGQEVSGAKLSGKVEEGLHSSLMRLYRQFDVADHERWSRVIEQARNGAGDALSAVGHTGDPEQHEVCKALLRAVGSGKSGADIRQTFAGRGYGWPRDAIDGGLFVLLASGHLRAADRDGQPVEPKSLSQGHITRTTFRQESATVTTGQRLKVRKVLQELGLPVTPGEEHNGAERVVAILRELAESAGGDSPRPERPATQHLEELASLQGNERLIALADRQLELIEQAQAWRRAGEEIQKRWPRWETLQQLLDHAQSLSDTRQLTERVDAIREQRLLLDSPDPVPDICEALTQQLRTALTQARQQYEDEFSREMAELEADSSWGQLDESQQVEILRTHGLGGTPTTTTGTEAEVLSSLSSMSLGTWQDRMAALPGRSDQARLEATRRVTPSATRVGLPSRTLHNEAEAQVWLDEVRALIEGGIKQGPLVV